MSLVGGRSCQPSSSALPLHPSRRTPVDRPARKPRAAAPAKLSVRALAPAPPPVDSGLPGERIARAAVDAAASKKADDIVLLDIRDVTSMADYFVICSASTDRQLKAVVEGIEQDLKEEGIRPVHVEGQQDSGWVLVDYGDVVCHILKPAEREYYRIEDLWAGAKTLVRML